MIISLEGPDQAGKRTQAGLLAEALRRAGHTSKMFSFPDYGTPIGQEIKRLLGGRAAPPPQVIHYLMSANRWERMDDIRRAASEHNALIMNRYYHSNIAYGIANGMERSLLEKLDRGLPESDLVILLSTTVAESLRRKQEMRDSFEQPEFQQRVAEVYGELAIEEGWKIIDAGTDRQLVHEEIARIALGALEK